MQEQEQIPESQKIKKLEREISILRYQNNRLLKYLRANKTFYKKRLENKKQSLASLKKQYEDLQTQIIINQKELKDEDIQN